MVFAPAYAAVRGRFLDKWPVGAGFVCHYSFSHGNKLYYIWTTCVQSRCSNLPSRN